MSQHFGDSVTSISWLGRIYRESVAKIDTYRRRVRDGQDAQAALEFGGFILWSGIIPLCREYAQESPKIDGDLLRGMAEELQRDARERLSAPDAASKVDAAQISGINRRLDVLAAHVARLRM